MWRQYFNGDVAAKSRIRGAVDLPHSPSSDEGSNSIVAERAADQILSFIGCQLFSGQGEGGIIQKCAGIPVRLKHGLHIPAKRMIACTHAIEKLDALVGRKLKGFLQDLIHLPPTLWGHRKELCMWCPVW